MEPIAIVGGGIIGTGLAYRLRNAPTTVRLFEKGTLGSGSTSASIAVFSRLTDHPTELGHRMRERAWDHYRSLIDDGEISYERIGSLMVAETEPYRRTLETAHDRFHELGLDTELLEPEELAAHNVDPSGTAGGLYADDVGYLDPNEVVQYWAREARASGVDIETGVEVTDVVTDEGSVRAIETTDGSYDAGTVINAAGPWAPRVNEMVGVSLPVRHTLGRILVLQNETDFSLPYVLFENGDYFREEGTAQAFAGRLEKEYDEATVLDPSVSRSVDEEFYRSVARSTEERVPILRDADVVNEWVGLRTVTPDKDPILGPTTVDGFQTAIGMSGLGITYAPAVTDLLARSLLSDDSGPDPDLTAFDADRFEQR